MEMNEAVQILYENGFELQPELNEKLAGSASEKYEIDKIRDFMAKLGYEWSFNEHSAAFWFRHPRKERIYGNLIPWTAYLIIENGKYYFGRSLKDWKKDMKTLGVI